MTVRNNVVHLWSLNRPNFYISQQHTYVLHMPFPGHVLVADGEFVHIAQCRRLVTNGSNDWISSDHYHLSCY